MHLICALFLYLTLALTLVSAAGAQSEIKRSVMGSGTMGAATGTVRIRSTLGQFVVDRGSASSNTLRSGFWSGDSAIPVGIGDDAAMAPILLSLAQNSPNPFNPRTRIEFNVPAATQRIRLRIFDVRGRQVRTLVDGPHPPGRHQVLWNGNDDQDRPVATGIYFYELAGAEKRITRKMVLVK